jgi:hypothetical protein
LAITPSMKAEWALPASMFILHAAPNEAFSKQLHSVLMSPSG